LVTQNTHPSHNYPTAITLVTIVLGQNYFQFDGHYYKHPTSIAMESPLSATMAEIYLRYIEELFIKHWLETREIIFYRRYIGDILIIFDTTKISMHTIQYFMKPINPLLHFTLTTEVKDTIKYLDLEIHRQNHTFELGIHYKPTQTDTTIH
jgi:hypothetical protein